MSARMIDDLRRHSSRTGERRNFFLCDGAVITDLPFLDVYNRVDRYASCCQTLFFSGEAGTGKSLMARTAHRWSSQAGALRTVDCRGDGLEAQLFGDAAAGKPGAIAEAAGGSLLLAHVDYLPLPLQARLPLVSPRLLLTSRAPLREALRSGRLLPRLAEQVAAELELPPLRRREHAVPELFAHFVQQMRPLGRPDWQPPTPDAAALDRLQRRKWPGNVLELRNVVVDLLLNAKEGAVGPRDLRVFPPGAFARPGDLGAASRQPQA